MVGTEEPHLLTWPAAWELCGLPHGLASGMLWKDCGDISGPWSIILCSSSLWALTICVRRLGAYRLALGMMVNSLGSHLVSSSILPMRREGLRRKGLRGSGWIPQVNKWLHSCCQQQGFGFYKHGILFEVQGLLERGTGSIWQSGSTAQRSTLKSFRVLVVYKTVSCCEKQDQGCQERKSFLPTSWDGLLTRSQVWEEQGIFSTKLH